MILYMNNGPLQWSGQHTTKLLMILYMKRVINFETDINFDRVSNKISMQTAVSTTGDALR